MTEPASLHDPECLILFKVQEAVKTIRVAHPEGSGLNHSTIQLLCHSTGAENKCV